MPDSDQDKFAQFEAAVRESFSFLETKYGFERRVLRLDKNTLIIRYETSSLYVVLTYGAPAYEPGMSFGRQGVDDVPGAYSFEAGDLIKLDSCKNWKWEKNYPNHIFGLVAEFARLLAECGKQCLDGNPRIFEVMKARRDKLIADWKRDERTNAIRREIAKAWELKDYKRVVELYPSIGDDLSELDKKRLQFAMSHL